MGEQAAIAIQDLSKVYKIFDRPVDRLKESLHPFHRRYSKDFHALQGISFDVQKGETIGIIGKNGAGKSTLLKIITGVLTPTSGQVEIHGRISSLLELGAGFNMEMTGRENIYLNGTLMGCSKAEMDGRLPDILAFADIGEFIEQPVKTYSSGMFARLAFAVAINVAPDLLIVDEALSVGDVFFQNKCFKKFAELRRKGITILFVSHDLGSVRQLCSRVLWLDHGQQRMFGPTADVCEAYFYEALKARGEIDDEVLADTLRMEAAASGVQAVFPLLQTTGKKLLSDDMAIRSFFVRDAQGHRLRVLRPGEKYTAVMAVEFSRAVQGVIFGFVLENRKGVQLFAFNSFISSGKKALSVDEPCVAAGEFSFELPLVASGEYLLSPAIAVGSQEEHEMRTWLENALAIRVENTQGFNLGLIELESEFRVHRYDTKQVQFKADC